MATQTQPAEAVEVPDRTVSRFTEAGLVEAQLDRLSQEIAVRRRQAADPSAPNEYLQRLVEERAALLKRPPRAGIDIDVVQQRLDGAVIKLTDLLFPWSVLNLPYMTEGIYERPSTHDVTGDLGTAGLYAGSIAYGGTLTQDGSGGPAERWWVHTWRNSAVFPAAPFNGRLYYRFAVDAECNI